MRQAELLAIVLYGAPVAVGRIAPEATLREAGDAFAQGLKGNALQHIVDKGVLEQEACFLLGNAALTHVEECRLVEFPHRRAVAALDVVGIDFQHGP